LITIKTSANAHCAFTTQKISKTGISAASTVNAAVLW